MKLSPEELAEAEVHRGYLTIDTNKHSGSTSAYLQRGDIPDNSGLGWIVQPLLGAQVRSMKGDAFVVTGTQRLEHYSANVGPHRQAWWCLVVRE